MHIKDLGISILMPPLLSLSCETKCRLGNRKLQYELGSFFDIIPMLSKNFIHMLYRWWLYFYNHKSNTWTANFIHKLAPVPIEPIPTLPEESNCEPGILQHQLAVHFLTARRRRIPQNLVQAEPVPLSCFECYADYWTEMLLAGE